jgi:hypothetical protein
VTITASRLAYLVTLDAAWLVALLVALLAPGLGAHLLGLGVCAALLMAHVDHVERSADGAGLDRGSPPRTASGSRRVRDALESAQPALLGAASVLVLLVRESPGRVVIVAATALVITSAVGCTGRRDRSGPRTPPTAAETWRARRPHRASDLAYALLLVAMGALIVVLPDEPGPVRAAASGAAAALLVVASLEELARRRSSTSRPATAGAEEG